MSPALLVHIAAGGLGMASGASALAVRKGGPLHRGSGGVFVGSMLVMASAAALLALSLRTGPTCPAPSSPLTLWSRVGRPSPTGGLWPDRGEHVGLVLGGAACACALLLAFEAHVSTTGLINGKPASPMARAITWSTTSTCARAATSGTTPP